LVPATVVMTGMPALFAAASWASASTGLPIAMMRPSTLPWIIASICSECFGRLPSELSICTYQPSCFAASAAALATRACVSDDIWNAMIPSLNACAGAGTISPTARMATPAAAATIFLITESPSSKWRSPKLDAECGFFERRRGQRDRSDDDNAKHDVLHVVLGTHQHEAVAQHADGRCADKRSRDVAAARLEHRHPEQHG